MSSTRPNYFLVDCNQFFVSCEQVFNPGLRNSPVVVLSSNDGCVVARSKEAKLLGIPMGAPAYQCEGTFKKENVHVLSSNFALYSDMSDRVMETLRKFSPNMEEYSIDEAFLYLCSEDPLQMAGQIQKKVLQDTGIPVSIGIGSTKTLAKVANDYAKSHSKEGIFLFHKQQADSVLQDIPLKEIWGIGRNLAPQLLSYGIQNALQLKEADPSWIRNLFSVTIMKIVLELQGKSCLTLQEMESSRQSITCSRSFGKSITSQEHLEQALSSYTAQAAEKLRRFSLSAYSLHVWLMTSPFREQSYRNSHTFSFSQATSYTPQLVRYAKQALGKIYKEGFLYKKVGITLFGLVPTSSLQHDFLSSSHLVTQKQDLAMQTLDRIHKKFGKTSLQFGAEGISQEWKAKKNRCSPHFTTSWDELLTISI